MGRSAFGQSHPRSLFTDHEVDLIRHLHEQGMGYQEIAEKFDTTRQCIYRICTYRTRCVNSQDVDWH